MANHLRMAMIQAIMTLHRRGWSKRRIARELGVDRGAVGRHLASLNAAGNSANPPPGIPAAATAAEDSKPATAAGNPPLGSNPEFAGMATTYDPVHSVIGPSPLEGLGVLHIHSWPTP